MNVFGFGGTAAAGAAPLKGWVVSFGSARAPPANGAAFEIGFATPPAGGKSASKVSGSVSVSDDIFELLKRSCIVVICSG